MYQRCSIVPQFRLVSFSLPCAPETLAPTVDSSQNWPTLGPEAPIMENGCFAQYSVRLIAVRQRVEFSTHSQAASKEPDVNQPA